MTMIAEAVGKRERKPLLVMCCVCKRVRTSEYRWLDVPEEYTEDFIVSHGFCPPCVKTAIESIDNKRRLET